MGTSTRGRRGPAPVGPRSRSAEPGPLRRFLRTHWYAWALTAPVVITMAVVIGFPFVRGLWLSFTDADRRNVSTRIGENVTPATYDFVGVDNYIAILTGEIGDFWPRLTWTVVWTVVCVACHFGIGLGLAVMLNRRVALRGTYRAIMILPWAVPPFVSAFIWRYLYQGEYGLFNAGLRGMGLPSVEWLGDPLWAKFAVITINVWLGIPFMMVALLGGLQSIPTQLYEAARVDGASPWQQFRHITLPSLRPVAAPVVLIGTIWTFNQFPVIFLVTGGGPARSTDLLVTYAFRLFGDGTYGAASAYGIVILGLLLVLAFIYQRALRQEGQAW